MKENEKQRSRAIQRDRSAAFEEITCLSDPANNTICWQSAVEFVLLVMSFLGDSLAGDAWRETWKNSIQF